MTGPDSSRDSVERPTTARQIVRQALTVDAWLAPVAFVAAYSVTHMGWLLLLLTGVFYFGLLGVETLLRGIIRKRHR